MHVLSRLPTDGTFHQTQPLDRIVNWKAYYSSDFTAATDRMPLLVLFHVMEHLFGSSFASACVNSTLATNTFDVPFVKGNTQRRSMVSFVVGQPLGYLSSWPLFALAHHFIVWVAAEQVYPGKRFWDYALLGDDIVIADKEVARSYRSIMEELRVSISDVKSLVSTHGAEFAKRFRVKGLTVDCSPVSIKNLMGSHHPMGITALKLMFPSLGFKTMMRFHGAGYKTLSVLFVACRRSTLGLQ